ncbi:MAG: DUF3108 domain-containing protein [Acidobacteria bacterium]|nr:DUF3108 domain-containing protein [Acidobacteriota bacterium]
MKRVNLTVGLLSFVFVWISICSLTDVSAFQDVAIQPEPTPTPGLNLPLATLRRDFKTGFPIPAGEKLEYEVRYSRFPLYVTVGIVTFEFLGPTQFDQAGTNGNADPAIAGLNVEFKPAPEDQFVRLRASAISKGLLIAIIGYDVKDRFETLVNPHDFSARLSFKEIKEGKKHQAQTAVFNLGTQSVNFTANDLNNQQAPVKEKSAAREDGMLDLLSAFYFVRMQKLREGQLIRFPVNDDGVNYWFDIAVGKHEKLKTDCGKIKTIKIEPKLLGPGKLISRPGEMTMWLTDDNLHIPVKLEAKTSSGTVKAKLLNLKNKCKLIDEDEKKQTLPKKTP